MDGNNALYFTIFSATAVLMVVSSLFEVILSIKMEMRKYHELRPVYLFTIFCFYCAIKT